LLRARCCSPALAWLRAAHCKQDRQRTAPQLRPTYRGAEGRTRDEVIMSIAGDVSRAMLSRYSHVRMEAKRRALDEIGGR
jgi:hypothetical protein